MHRVRIGLLIKTVCGNRNRGRSSLRIHAFEDESIVIQNGENRIAAAGYAAQRGAFDNLSHMHRKSGWKSQHRRQGGEDAGVAGSAGDDHIDIHFQRFAEWPRAHLPDDIGGVPHVLFGQRRHVVQAGDPPGSHRFKQHGSIRVCRYHRHAER